MLTIVCVGLSTSFFTSASKEKDANESGVVMTRDSFLQKWSEDFKNRNAQGIIDASTDEVQQTLREVLTLCGILPMMGNGVP